jgi:peptidoglycan/xylan/chitin deacetylase (PgdA/CDA1 family)
MFRFLNRNKLLVIMYHGVTADHFNPPVWTQLPVGTFRRQIEFLRNNYQIVTLGEIVEAVRSNKPFSKRAALVTFDDGLKNNFNVAFPVLKNLGVPATIFLTVDLVGTKEILWFDECSLIFHEAALRNLEPALPGADALEHFRAGRIECAYADCVEQMKRSGHEKRQSQMEKLRVSVPVDKGRWLGNFGFLDWDEIKCMQQSGLIDFGVHTASHCILTELSEDRWEREIVEPKLKLEARLGTKVDAFCYPNGRPAIDFHSGHIEYLRKRGYVCAFTTEEEIFSWPRLDCMAIGRVPVGNDGTSEPAYFRLNTSGAIHFLRRAWPIK